MAKAVKSGLFYYLIFVLAVVGLLLFVKAYLPEKTVAGEAFKFVVDNNEFAGNFNLPLIKDIPKQISLIIDSKAEKALFELSGTGSDIELVIGDKKIFVGKGVLSGDVFLINDFDGKPSLEATAPASVKITLPRTASVTSAKVNLDVTAEEKPSEEPVNIPVLVLKYFPLDDAGKVDKSIVGGGLSDDELNLPVLRLKVDKLTKRGFADIEKASAYKAYSDTEATPYIAHSLVDDIEHLEPIPQTFYVLDGNPESGKWSPRPGFVGDSFLVDLGEIKTLGSVTLYFWYVDRPEKFHILSSETGQFAGEEKTIVSESDGLSGYSKISQTSAIEKKVYSFNPASARYVKLVVDAWRANDPEGKGSQINLYEMELGVDVSAVVESSPDASAKANSFAYLQRENICDYVDNKGVKEVWVWMYHSDTTYPIESNMAMGRLSRDYWNYDGYGDVSNSYRENDLPICDNTYTVYEFNYGRGIGELIEDFGHQFEAIFNYVDNDLFWNKFVGPFGDQSGLRHCGWTHFAPNGKSDYDWFGETSVLSDCEDWKPDGSGFKKSVNCHTWAGEVCSNDGGEAWKIWWMQNLPGKDNKLSVNGKPLRNWWEFVADFDEAIAKGKTLVTAEDSKVASVEGHKITLNSREIKSGSVDISSFIKSCGSDLCDSDLSFTSSKPVSLKLSNLELKYGIPPVDFSSYLNEYCKSYPCKIPLSAKSSSDGELSLHNIEIVTKEVAKGCNKDSICDKTEDEASCPDDCLAIPSDAGMTDTNLKDVKIKIGGQSPGKRPEGNAIVEIKESDNSVVEFGMDFSVKQLDLSNLKIEKQTAGRGVVWVKGLDLGDSTKTIYLDKLNTNTNVVCIKDAEVESLSTISPDCNGQEEVLLRCDGTQRGKYACSIFGNSYKVSGLSHSVVYEPSQDTQMPVLPIVNASNNTDGSVSINWSVVGSAVAGNPLSGVIYYLFKVSANPSSANISGLDTAISPFSMQYIANFSSQLTFTDNNVSNNTIYLYAVTTAFDALYNASVLNMLLINNTATSNATLCHSEYDDWSAWGACESSIQARTRSRICKGATEMAAETRPCQVQQSTSPTASTGNSGGGGGGGGGSTLPSENFLLQKTLTKGDRGTFLYKKFPDLAVSEIIIEAEAAATNPAIIVKETTPVASMALPMPKESGKVYKYISITKSNLETVAKTTIKFAIPKDWFTNNSLDQSTVSLTKLMSNSWVKLPTKQISSGLKYANYEAVTEGFSIFSITAEKAKAQGNGTVSELTKTGLPAKTPFPPAEQQAIKPVNESQVNFTEQIKPAQTEVAKPKIERKGGGAGFALKVVLLLVLIISGILAFVELLHKLQEDKRSKQAAVAKKEKLREYITEKISEGFKPVQIRDALVKNGWPEDYVEKAILDMIRKR